MNDLVRNERSAVKHLKTGVSRFAEDMREAMAKARTELAGEHRRAEQVAERRQSELRRAQRELQQASAALARCERDCGGLHAAVAAARQQVTERSQAHDRARRGVARIAEAQRDLQQVFHVLEAKVGEHSSVASSALATIEARLAALGGGRHHALDVARGAIVGVELFGLAHGGAMDMSNAAHAVDLAAPGGDTSTAEMVERHDEENQLYVLEEGVKAESKRLWGDLQEGE